MGKKRGQVQEKRFSRVAFEVGALYLLSMRFKLYLALEFALIFAGAPLLIGFVQDRLLMAGLLWAGALGAFLWLRRRRRTGELARPSVSRRDVTHVGLRFLAAAAALSLCILWLAPADLFGFVRESPARWALVMLLYPLLSAWPQEMLYRAFLFERYRPLFPGIAAPVLVSALAFGLMHLIFGNWLAVALSAAGGLLFASTYARTRSLALCTAEHALYGGLIFTLGLGRYFYSGAAWG